MSLKAVERVLEHSTQKGSALAVLLILAHRANKQSVCWPKVETLARYTRLRQRQTQELLAALEEAGEIEIRRNTTGQWLANFYLVKVGDPAIQWPERLPEQRVHSSAETGAAERTPSAKRVHPGAQTGALQRNERVHSSAEGTPGEGERVHSSAQTGAPGRTPLKESELKEELKDSTTSSTSVPSELVRFDAKLRGLPGYEPDGDFFDAILAEFGDLNLMAEAIKIRNWILRKKGKEACSQARILNWLNKAKHPESFGRKEGNHGESGHGPGDGHEQHSANRGSEGPGGLEEHFGF